jgi:tetratricopeptide (TPR) repeat protein
LLGSESGDSPEGLTPDDTLILVGEILRAHEHAGTKGVVDLLQQHALDWRPPLACVWSAIDDRAELAHALAVTPHLPALEAALRANHTEPEAAAVLASSAASSLPSVLAQLVSFGEIDFALKVAQAAGASTSSPAGDQTTGGENPPVGRLALNARLQAGWELQKAELAALTDAIASAAERDGDPVSGVEARQQALQLAPSDARLAGLALSLVRAGDTARALEMIPPGALGHSLRLAAGVAFAAGGAVEKGRALLVSTAVEDLRSIAPDSLLALASSLAASGETGLAVETLQVHLDRTPGDSVARLAYAQLLLEDGDPDGALAQAALLCALAPLSKEPLQIEAEALAELGRADEAIPLLKLIGGDHDPRSWRRLAACAAAAGQTAQLDDLLAATPEGIGHAEVALLRAQGLTSQGKRTEAAEVLEMGLVENPGAANLWIALAEGQSNPEATGETLRRANQMVPGSAAINAALARWLRLRGRASEAFDAAARAIQADPNDPEGRFEAGAALLDLGRPTEAHEHLRSAHRLQPGRHDVRLALAASFEASGDLEAARSLFRHLPDSAPPAAWFTSGRLDLAQEASADPLQAKEAASRILRARTLGYQDPSLDYWLGVAFDRSNDAERAARAYGDFLAGGPRETSFAAAASVRKAHCLLEAGRIDEAVRDFGALRKARGDSPDILRPLALACLRASLTDEAREAAETLLRSDPVDRQALHVLDSIARATGDWRPASKALYAAAERAQTDATLWIEAGEAGLRRGSPDLARQAIGRSLAADPDLATRRRAALALVELGESSQAASLLKEVAAATPDDPSLWIELADVCARMGDRESEVEALSRAATLKPNEAELHARHADALWSLGRHSESIGAWHNAHELAPDDPRVHGGLARALVVHGEVQEGRNEFAQALRTHPSDDLLRIEAGLATLRHGSAKEAVDLLRPAFGHEGLDVRALVGLGEAWLRLRQPERAAQALRLACDSPTAGAGAWALLAEAELSLGDHSAADRAISQARRRETPDADERIALARAELRIGNWKDALTALTPVLLGNDPVGEGALVETILRILEARWLLGDAGQVRRHLPGLDLPGASLSSWLESRLLGPAASGKMGRLAALRLSLVKSQDGDDEALVALQSACQEETAGEEALEALAIALLARRRPLEVLEALRRIEPDMLGASWQAVLAGLAHLQTGNAALAEQAFDDATQDAGQRPMALALLARAQLARRNVEAAIGSLNEALSRWPEEPVWQATLANLYLEQGSLDSALPHLQSAAELEPEDSQVLLLLARTLRQAGHLGEALHAYERVLPLTPAMPGVWHEAGETAIACGDFARAESCFERAASLAPGEPKHVIGLADAALVAGKVRDARRHAERALRVAGEDSAALQCLAAVVAKQGEGDAALRLLDRAISAAEDPAPVRAARSRLLIDIGRADVAAAELRDYLAGAPEDEDGWRTLAEALEATGDLAEAGQAAEAALRLAPRSPLLHIQLARVSRKMGHLDRALDELRRAEEIRPLDPELSLEFGQIYEARRELDRALEFYLRSAELGPDSPAAFLRAAAVLKTLKAYADAGRMLERAAELDPTNTTALQQLAAVRALELVHGGTYSMAVTP